MNLNEIQANIRLRNPWEAVDLGFTMVQTWWKEIYFPLAILIFGITIPLYLIVPRDQMWIAGMIIWWFKPLYDRLVLHIISHKLFNEQLSSWQALRALPSLMWNTGFFQTMTFRRFSLSRGFNLPIWQLEQLRGEPRVNRQNVLHIAAHSQAMWLTIGLWLIEAVLSVSLFVLIFLFLPENIQRDFFENFFNKKVEYAQWIDILNYTFYALVLTAIHPFYVAGNFALYINRRTQLEAWDIELDFKNMAKRLQQITKMAVPFLFLISITLSLSLLPSPSYAELPKPPENTETNQLTDDTDYETEFLNHERLHADKSKAVIEAVMLTEYLDDKVVSTRWVKKKEDKKKDEEKSDSGFFDILKEILKPAGKFFAFIFEFGLWILVGFGILLLIYYRDRWLHLLNIETKKKTDDYQSPDIMFGMDVRPESLPEDIAEEARQLWQSGQHRESLSLLYRGALVRLINQEKVKLENSHTEGDVLRHASAKITSTKQSYLNELTTQWKLIAYAHRAPAEADMQHLFNHWHSDFAVETNQASPEGDSHE